MLTIALKTMNDVDRYCTITTNDSSRVLKFNEEYLCEDGKTNGGVYVFSKNDALLRGKQRSFLLRLPLCKRSVARQVASLE